MKPGPAAQPQSFAQARRNMVDGQLRTFDVTDRAVLAAMDEVPRESFVPDASVPLAYSDRILDLAPAGGERRFMLPPMVLARMLQALEIEAGQRVLDIGCGLGYSSAVLARMGAAVTGLESDARLAEEARKRLAATGAGAVTILEGCLSDGCPDAAPFDAVVLNGTVIDPPSSLIAQLSAAGRLVCLVEAIGASRATLFVRAGAASGSRALFDAGVPVLDAFRPPPSFRF